MQSEREYRKSGGGAKVPFVKPELKSLHVKWGYPSQLKSEFKRNDPCPCGSGKKYKKCCLMQVRYI